MDYGSDLRLDRDRDVILDPAGGLVEISGPELVAQDLAEELSIPRGSLPWDREAGSDLLFWLNDRSPRDYEVEGELRRVALRDPRVDAATVTAARDGAGYALRFRAAGSLAEQTLRFDLSDLERRHV